MKNICKQIHLLLTKIYSILYNKIADIQKNPEKEKGGKTTMRILSRSAGYGGNNAQIYDCFSSWISL